MIFAIIVVLLGASWPAQAQKQRYVNFYNWSDYLDLGVLDDFTKATGIKVRYDTFDSNDTLEAKLLAGNSGYDVVVPTGYFLQRQIAAGIFQKLDKSKLPNLVNVWPEIAKRLAFYDPGQPIRHQLHVGHDRHRLQREEGEGIARTRTSRSIAGAMCSIRTRSASSRIAACICWIHPTISCRPR